MLEWDQMTEPGRHIRCIHIKVFVGWWLAGLTGSPTVTTPMSLTTLGCQNCPLMAASCRNFTVSSSVEPSLSILTATSLELPGRSHVPFITVPNWPEPMNFFSLNETDYIEIWLHIVSVECFTKLEFLLPPSAVKYSNYYLWLYCIP